MTAQFTPGPWIPRKCGVYQDKLLIACTGDDEDCGITCEAQVANAKLIAAAPELFEALRKIANPSVLAADPSNFGKFPEAFQRYAMEVARAALAKAQGA